jgi:hypothetical protein
MHLFANIKGKICPETAIQAPTSGQLTADLRGDKPGFSTDTFFTAPTPPQSAGAASYPSPQLPKLPAAAAHA